MTKSFVPWLIGFHRPDAIRPFDNLVNGNRWLLNACSHERPISVCEAIHHVQAGPENAFHILSAYADVIGVEVEFHNAKPWVQFLHQLPHRVAADEQDRRALVLRRLDQDDLWQMASALHQHVSCANLL